MLMLNVVFMTFPKVTPTFGKGKYSLYSYIHGSCTLLGYKDCLQTVTESVIDCKKHTQTHTHTQTVPYRPLSTTPYTTFKDQSSDIFRNNHQGPVY